MTFVCSENQCGYLTKRSGLWNRHWYQRYCSLPVSNCLGEDTNASLCPKKNNKQTKRHKHTHKLFVAFAQTVQSDCIVPHRRRWLPCRQSWVPFPFNHGWDCTGTHTHSCTLTNMHSHSDNAPIIGWTERGVGAKRGTQSGGCVSIFSHIDFPSWYTRIQALYHVESL